MKLIIHMPGHYEFTHAKSKAAKYPSGTDIMLLVCDDPPKYKEINTSRSSINVVMRAILKENTARMKAEKRAQIRRYLSENILTDPDYLLKLEWTDRKGNPLDIDTVKANLVLCEIGP